MVLAEVLGGYAIPFLPTSGGYASGSYVAFAGDEHGTAIEVYPLGTELVPGDGSDQAESCYNEAPSRFTATHAAISVSASVQTVEQVGVREGWRVLRCSRGLRSSGRFFEVLEFWIENRLMLELLTPEMARQYTAFLSPANLEPMLVSSHVACVS